jgi:hypothetical protein
MDQYMTRSTIDSHPDTSNTIASRPLGKFALCFVVIFCALLSAPASGYSPAEALEISHHFDETDYLPGENGTVAIVVRNPGIHEKSIFQVRMQADWLLPDTFYDDNNTSGPLSLAEGQSRTFFIGFSVPATANAVDHSWNVTIHYQQNNSGTLDNETWRSGELKDLNVSDFTLSIDPVSRTIKQGQTTTYLVTVTGINGFSKEVIVYTTSWERDLQAYPDTSSVKGNGTFIIEVQRTASLEPAKYQFFATGKCLLAPLEEGQFWTDEPGLIRTAEASVTIKPAREKDWWELSVNNIALIGIVATGILAILTVGLFVMEMHKNKKKTG